jgi:Uncharacterized conserved protein
VCFVGSAAVRLGEVGAGVVDGGLVDLGGAAVAQDAAAGPPEPTAVRPDAVPAREATLAEQAAACDAPPGPLLTAIRRQVEALDAREARVAERERLLEATESRVRAEIDRLEAAEAALAQTLALADGASERDVAHLVGVYETMKPKNAAGIFNAMEPQFAAGFLARMREDAAAGILAAMNEAAAYAVTVVMAGRHVGAGGATTQPGAGSPPVQDSGG